MSPNPTKRTGSQNNWTETPVPTARTPIARIAEATKKSKSCESTADRGKISRGTYTFVSRLELLIEALRPKADRRHEKSVRRRFDGNGSDIARLNLRRPIRLRTRSEPQRRR